MNRSPTQTEQQAKMTENDSAALAAEIFDHFSSASTMRQVLELYRSMCYTINLRPGPLNEFYPKLKSKIKSWKAQALWKKFDARASHRVYNKGTACSGTRVLVIGAGPCGLRTAIEAQLLGAKVVLVEKRDRFSRNNVLHLWPFLITDLRNLGAKKFYGKFCAGSIDHISIRQLQCILLKVALLLGVEVHEGVSFYKTIEPKDDCGWRAEVGPADHAISHYEFDALVGADGKRNTLEGFRRKEFRGKLAIAITANFINKKTWAEAKVEEISGVAFIFNQSFFKELYQTTGIDLENIVYYKDETHYFVMTAKKHSLIDKGVIMQDFADPAELLASHNVNTERLLDYAQEAAGFSTKYQMPNVEFAVNHYGKPDVAMFDFTSMFQAETSCRVTVRKNYRLLQCLVGDSLLEPFWPTGSGCARGFLSSMDAAYAIKLWSNQRNSALAVLAQRESIYRLLAQTTPENLHRDIGSYTLDPATRYPNLNKTTVNVHQVKHLVDSDDATILEQIFIDTNALHSAPEPMPRRKRRTGDTVPLGTVLLRWIKAQLHSFEFTHNIVEVSECFTNGQILCCLINRYRPDLVDLSTLKDCSAAECNEQAFTIIEHEMGIPRIMSGKDSIILESIDSKVWLSYLEQVCDVFRGEVPHVKHPKLDLTKIRENKAMAAPDFSRLLKYTSRKARSPSNEVDMGTTSKRTDDERPRRTRKFDSPATPVTAEPQTRRARKRRSHEKVGNIEERAQRLQEIEANRYDRQNRRRLHRQQQTENFYKSIHMLQANNYIRETDSSTPFEDYSIFMYRQSAPEFNDRVKELERKLLYPDRERGIQSAIPRNGPDDQFNDRIKSMEQRIVGKSATITDKKPKDLLRAIGKIESSDWNFREIEKKIEQSKKTEVGKSREKVPKWSKEQFLQRQNKMARPQDEEVVDDKYKTIDETIKNADRQIKEGNVLERGKVASIAGNFIKKDEIPIVEEKGIQKSSSKVGLVFNKQKVTDVCHFCNQRVYLMEKIAAENLVMHRSCLKCHHCHNSLRLGSYAFDRDDPDGRFYCTQHFRLPAKIVRPMPKKTVAKVRETELAATPRVTKTPEKIRGRPEGVAQLDLLDRGQTPERIEFENADAMSDGEPSVDNVIDENEWTDRNFGTGTEESDTDFSSSDESDSDSNSDIYEEAMGSPLGAQTLQLATDWIGKQRYTSNQYSDEDDSYVTSEDDDVESQTEGEELERAREIRRQEFKLQPVPFLPTDTETEVQTDSDDSSSAVGLNSATEISTDSEFERDPVIRDAPKIYIDDSHLKKPTRVQVKQRTIENGRHKTSPTKPIPLQHAKTDIHLEFKPLVQVDPSVLVSNRAPLQNPRVGNYNLQQTASTEGIASKKSLELKKRYLLGETGLSSGIMKSDSTSVLDSKFKNFHSTITGCQKLLNHPSADTNPAMQHFLKNTHISDNKSSSQTENTTSRETVKEVKPEIIKNVEEKENVYDRIVSTKNELNKSDVELSKPSKILDYSETVNMVLVENKLKELSSKPVDTIDLTTPEKVDATAPIIDIARIELSQKVIANNQAFINAMHPTTEQNNLVIDLTGDTPEKEQIIKPKVESPSYEGARDSAKIKLEMSPEKTKNAIDSMLHKQSSDQSRSPIHETSITVPKIPWKPKNIVKDDVESDSLSSSSSSVDDIPHYILDSTTSPDTQPGDRFVPRLEVRDTSGELMQIDSLMIIDGKYVGDPEDLKHMKMPDINEKPTIAAAPHPSETSRTNVSLTKIGPAIATKAQPEYVSRVVPSNTTKVEINVSTSTVQPAKTTTTITERRRPVYRYESINRKPDLKFDTRNENKIDSLKNLPLILPQVAAVDAQKQAKPTDLPLAKHSDAKKASDNSDNDKTPTVANPGPPQKISEAVSDSETEMTGQALTETELSDWTADDAVSENFVDIEFALNSNKGTIKRNKKSKRKNSSHKHHHNGPAPATMECPIAKDLDFDNIEFMDTGSEDSCVETYSATNKAMLKNRGYVQFVNTSAPLKHPYNIRNTSVYSSSIDKQSKPNSIDIGEGTRNIEVPGIDYIEQGACILAANEIDLKTPMNELPPIFGINRPFEQHDSLNEIEDDSLVMVASQGGNTTTEESDALTVVTSPMESTTPRIIGSSSVNSSFDKTGSSSTNKGSPSKKYASHEILTPTNESPIKRKPSQEDILNSTGRKDSDDMSYEEYVRQLQLKITQISNARDSIDVRKTKRKYSKGDSSFDIQLQPNTVIDNNSKPLSIYVNKSTEPATETEKIEVLTKERTKQKDLIHDLVMNKLQSKKQLNAEKRLNRSRNRNSILSPPQSNSSGISPASSSISMPHNPVSCGLNSPYRPSQSTDLYNSMKLIDAERQTNSLYNSSKSVVKPNEQYFATPIKHLHSVAAKERPRSDNIEGYPVFETPKLNKTQSFCVYGNRNPSNPIRYNQSPHQSQFADNISNFSTPIAPNRRAFDDSITQTTEKMRLDARNRARLKSNQDLGISPEEKIAMLRKRYNMDVSNATSQTPSVAPSSTGSTSGADIVGVMNKSDDMKVRERKMMSSKSVNDIALVNNSGDSSSSPKGAQKLIDSSSDPNLLDGKMPSKRRHKDPERRKSIIQAVSDFFHKKKEKEPSSPKEKSEGMFGRFRISPKNKSKDKEELSYERSKSEDCLKLKQNSSYSSGCHSEELTPPPIPPLPTNYQRSDDESYSANESRDQKKIRAISKASRQGELKRLRIAQEIQREQEEIEVKLKDLEARGVLIEKALRGEGQNLEEMDPNTSVGANDEKLLKELLEIWRNITHLKKRDEELGIRQKELQLEHRHAQLKEELNLRLSCSRLDKSSSDVAAEGALLNEMLEIVAKRAALRPSDAGQSLECNTTDALDSDII